MRAVLDTNILARPAYRDTGPAGEVLGRISRSPHVLVMSSAILQELKRVLRYPRMRQLHRLSDDQINQYLVDIETAALVVSPQPDQVSPVVSDDPDDDLVIATAIVGQAEKLCTLDRHLHQPQVREYCKQRGIEILTDVELLDLLRTTE